MHRIDYLLLTIPPKLHHYIIKHYLFFISFLTLLNTNYYYIYILIYMKSNLKTHTRTSYKIPSSNQQNLEDSEAFLQKFDHHKNSKNNNKTKNQKIQKKNQLMKILNDILGQLHNNLQANDKSDKVLMTLQEIEETSKQFDFYDIKRLAVLAIGKRIINLQIYKKQQQFRTKQKRKDELQQQYRQHRIKQFNYDEQELQKFQHRIFIAKPYQNCKGFNPFSSKYMNEYQLAFKYAQFYQTIKQINKICYGDSKKQKQKLNKLNTESIVFGLTKLIFFCIICLFGIVIYINSFLNKQQFIMLCYVFFVLITGLIILNTIIIVKSYLKIPDNKTEQEKIRENIIQYLKQVNELTMNNEDKKIKYIWNVPDEFLYVQVKFLDRLPQIV